MTTSMSCSTRKKVVPPSRSASITSRSVFVRTGLTPATGSSSMTILGDAIERHLPLVRRVKSDDDIEQGRLTRSVWTDQTRDPTSLDAECTLVHGLDPTKGLGNLPHGEDGHGSHSLRGTNRRSGRSPCGRNITRRIRTIPIAIRRWSEI